MTFITFLNMKIPHQENVVVFDREGMQDFSNATQFF